MAVTVSDLRKKSIKKGTETLYEAHLSDGRTVLTSDALHAGILGRAQVEELQLTFDTNLVRGRGTFPDSEWITGEIRATEKLFSSEPKENRENDKYVSGKDKYFRLDILVIAKGFDLPLEETLAVADRLLLWVEGNQEELEEDEGIEF